ncbi:hypothetical protein ACRZIA_003094 [Klebsiella michiganensis]|uniref:hypothetical protein n=1 Tax=Klebsiella michiganensis TaxID=1134687 RepID=UPI0018C7E74C|nr:hypothetical protein [Klebsiella michiganensis]MBG2667300.1 hypothetical protein [Klebsiella michiganensis]MBG2673118.1 hypothetical protein [Klebsiella michiganensis]MBG2678459.1 hypothetical protein [Klebsiella michiganensis]
MNIETVNELIQSLESAGELSIKETKVMALAKAYLDVAAENAELKEDRDTLARYWIEDGGDEDCAMSYCEPTPATDRIVAGIKAEAKSHDLNAFISHYSAELDAHIESGGDQFDAKSVRLRSFIVGGRMFREKLRDEDKALALREGADK